MSSPSWCPTCEESSPSHPDNMCTTCGDELTSLPAGAISRVSQPSSFPPRDGSRGGHNRRRTTQNDDANANANANIANHNITAMHPLLDHYLRNTHDDGTANIIRLHGNNANNDIDNSNLADIASLLPPEALNPQAGPARHHPVSKKVLKEIQNKKTVLTEQSAELFDASVILSEPRSLEAHGKRPATSDSAQELLVLNAIPGEFVRHRDADTRTSTAYSKAAPTTTASMPENSFHAAAAAAALVICSPLTTKGGKLSPSTLHRIRILRKHRIPFIGYVERGDGITFVQKALACQRAGDVDDDEGADADGSSANRSPCIGVIVGNRGTTKSRPSEVWPYVMQDTKGEAETFGLRVPVVMVRGEDGERLIRWASRSPAAMGEGTTVATEDATMGTDERARTANRDLHPQKECCGFVPCRIRIRPKESNACPVCTDNFRAGDTVVRLPLCGHVFHEGCVVAWLTKHNTCPYCRREYPTEDEGFEAERRWRERERERERGSVGVGVDGHDFYG
ncbi:hypothetical protein ACHAXS_011103 [Conticribra weissflogii]